MARPFLLRQQKQQHKLFTRLLFIIGIIVLILALFPLHNPVNAQNSEPDTSFGIRPTKAHEQRPESFGYFSYGLSPGVQVNDEAIVINSGSEPITLKLYAADGITTQNGGTGFTEQGKLSPGGSHGVSNWITLETNEITLAPGEELTVPFTLLIPADAKPGHHVAGLVVESFPDTTANPVAVEGETQFTVNVIRRVGVAVVIDVPGQHTAGLEFKRLSLLRQSENGATVTITLHNTGNIYMKTKGFLLITDKSQNVLANFPLELDTILPGDEAIFYITLPIELSDSDYLLHASLTHDGGAVFIENVEVNIRKGQPVGEEDLSGVVFPPSITKIFSTTFLNDVDAFLYNNRIFLIGTLVLVGLAEIGLLIFYFRDKSINKQ